MFKNKSKMAFIDTKTWVVQH